MTRIKDVSSAFGKSGIYFGLGVKLNPNQTYTGWVPVPLEFFDQARKFALTFTWLAGEHQIPLLQTVPMQSLGKYIGVIENGKKQSPPILVDGYPIAIRVSPKGFGVKAVDPENNGILQKRAHYFFQHVHYDDDESDTEEITDFIIPEDNSLNGLTNTMPDVRTIDKMAIAFGSQKRLDTALVLYVTVCRAPS